MELDLKDYFRIIRKRWILITAIVLISSLTAAVVSLFVLKPVYEASTKIIVNSSNDRIGTQQLDLNAVNLNLRLIETYKEIIKTGAIMEKVAEEYPQFDISPQQLINRVNIQTVNNSQVITLSIQDEDHNRAVQIVNAISEVFQREIPYIMTVDNVSILDRAKTTENPAPVKPNPKLNTALAFVISLMFAVGIVFLIEYMDDTVKTEQDVRLYLKLPVLAEIVKIQESEFNEANKKTVQTKAVESKSVTLN